MNQDKFLYKIHEFRFHFPLGPHLNDTIYLSFHFAQSTRHNTNIYMQKLSDQCLFRAMAEMTMRRIKKTTEIDAATTAVLAVWQKSPNC